MLGYFSPGQRDVADVVRAGLGFRDEAFGVGRVGRVRITVERLPDETSGAAVSAAAAGSAPEPPSSAPPRAPSAEWAAVAECPKELLVAPLAARARSGRP